MTDMKTALRVSVAITILFFASMFIASASWYSDAVDNYSNTLAHSNYNQVVRAPASTYNAAAVAYYNYINYWYGNWYPGGIWY